MIKFSELKAGTWYIPVFERIEPLAVFGNINDTHRTDNPYYQYLGGKEFETEEGVAVECFFDPELQLNVAVDAADGFIY